MINVRRIGMSAIALVMIAGQAAIAQDKAITLEYKYKQGDTYRTKATINASVGGMDAVVNATTKTEIKEVKKNGEVVVVNTNEGGKVSLGGMEIDQPASPPITSTRNKLGKLVDYKADDAAMGFLAPEIQKLAAILNEQIFSEKPVKKDDTWTTEVENPAVKEKKVSVKGTFLGTETVDGKTLWKVKQNAEAATDKDGNKLVLEMTSWIDPENGWVVKSEGTLKDLPTQYGPMSWTMKMELIKK